MSDNRIIIKRITKSSPLSSGAELQIHKIAAQIAAKVKYRIIRNPLTLIISAMALEACGGGSANTAIGGSISNYKHSWSIGQTLPTTIEEQPAQGEDPVGLRLQGVDIADVTFARNPIVSDPADDNDKFTTRDVTLTIAGQSGVSVILPYTEIAGSDPVSYYQGVESVHFDTDDDGIVGAGELELKLIYQRQFNNGVDTAELTTATTDAGVTSSADLIIGFDIANIQDGSGNFVRDLIRAGAGDDYVYGLHGDDEIYGEAGSDTLYGGMGNDRLYGGADSDTLYGGMGDDYLYGNTGNDILYGGAGIDYLYGSAGDDNLNGGAGDDNLYSGVGNDTLNGGAGNDRFFFYKGDGDDEITEAENGGDDTLVLGGFVTNDLQSVERVDDTGMVDMNGIHLKLTFTNAAYGGSVLLRNSINNDATGVDKIHFDSNRNGSEDNDDTVWLDEDYVSYLGYFEIIFGDPDDSVPRRVDDSYSWSSGSGLRVIIYEQPAQGVDTVRLGETSIADVTFARNPIVSDPADDNDKFTTADVTLTIAESSQDAADGGSVVLSYAQIAGATGYYQGVEKVHFDTDDDGSVNNGELELNLIYQRQFNNGVAVTAETTVTTTGSGSADLIIGFDIAGEQDSSNNYVRDRIQAGAGDDYVYGLKGDDVLYGNAGNDRLYGNAGDDRFYFERGDGDDEITEAANEGDDTLVLTDFNTIDVQSVERVNDAGTIDTNGSHLKLIFTPTVSGGSILLKDSFNSDATGVDRIHFDSDGDGEFDEGEIIWLDENYGSSPGGSSNINYKYSWDRGDQLLDITEGQPAQGEDAVGLRLNGVDIADVTFGRNPVSGDQLTTASVTLSIAGQAGVSVSLSYAQIAGVADTYYQGVEKVYFDTRELNLIYQRRFNDGNVADDFDTVTTMSDGDSADLIIGFDIAGTQDSSGNYVSDYIRAGAGNDYVYGLNGHDFLYGGADSDTLYGGAGDDYLYGDDNLIVDGNLIVDAGIDYLYGEDGDDRLTGGAGGDYLYGGADSDNLYGGDGNDNLYGGADDDSLYGNVDNDNLYGGDGNDTLLGGDGNDYLYGNTGNDNLSGNDGDDTYIWARGDGGDTIYEKPGEGDDKLILTSIDIADMTFFRTHEALPPPTDSTDGTPFFRTTNVTLTITGQSGGSVVLPHKEITGAAGTYYQGVEKVHFDTDGDGRVNNGEVYLNLVYEPTAPASKSPFDPTITTGTDSADLIIGFNTEGTGYSATPTIDAFDFVQQINALAGDDYVYGLNGADTINGGADNDNLYGGADNDDLYGDAGNDRLYGGTGIDKLYGGTGDDNLYGGTGDDNLYGGADNDILDGGAGVDHIYGNDDDDTLYGGANDDQLYGNAGNDTLYGGDHNDILDGGAGNDILDGGTGNDTLSGGAGNDTLYGEAGNDTLSGGAGNDTLYGEAGNDTLDGKAGNDILYGGTGNDRFDFFKGDGDDEITEATNGGDDTLVLRGFSTADVRSLERRDDNGVSATGNHLKLTFTNTALGGSGGSVLLKYSVNDNDTGVDRIHFDSDGDEIEDDGEIIWQDGNFTTVELG